MFEAILGHRMRGEPMGEIAQRVVLVDDDRQVTMSLCPVCGQPIQAGKQHECEPVVLACIIDSLRSRYDSLEWDLAAALNERDEAHALREVAAKNWHRVTKERSEARQWARKLYAENSKLRRQLDKAEKDLRFNDAVAEVRAVSDADARDEAIKQARNDALDEAAQACISSEWIQITNGQVVTSEIIIDCARRIANLKDNSCKLTKRISNA